jgi:hypothetical protein
MPCLPRLGLASATRAIAGGRRTSVHIQRVARIVAAPTRGRGACEWRFANNERTPSIGSGRTHRTGRAQVISSTTTLRSGRDLRGNASESLLADAAETPLGCTANACRHRASARIRRVRAQAESDCAGERWCAGCGARRRSLFDPPTRTTCECTTAIPSVSRRGKRRDKSGHSRARSAVGDSRDFEADSAITGTRAQTRTSGRASVSARCGERQSEADTIGAAQRSSRGSGQRDDARSITTDCGRGCGQIDSPTRSGKRRPRGRSDIFFCD